ncbi:hypothetical protein B0H19DRAFT_1063372 [Mycena capillaripes]|nr:hypothetical protein B0H19DRAFT_1063372 [Mycena capillaripes]
MKPVTSLVALLSLATLGASLATTYQGSLSACKASDRVLVQTRNLTAAGHQIQISTKACSADALTSRSLEKRQVLNACVTGPGPLEADCLALETALPAALAAEGNPTTFEVAPQFVEEFTLGTCLWAWINNNPFGGATLEECFSNVELSGKNLDAECVAFGDTAGIAVPNNPALPAAELAWIFESRLQESESEELSIWRYSFVLTFPVRVRDRWSTETRQRLLCKERPEEPSQGFRVTVH